MINIAGHCLGTREIEELTSGHLGVADSLKGQVALAFMVARNNAVLSDAETSEALKRARCPRVDGHLGVVARPAKVRFVSLPPKTRSGQLLRRASQAVAEQKNTGDLSTMADPAAL